MESSRSSRRSSGPVLPITTASGRFSSSLMSDVSSSFDVSSPFASSTSSSFYSSPLSSSNYNLQRPSSPTRVNLHGLASGTSSPSVRFSIGRSASPNRSFSVASPRDQVVRKQNSANPLSKIPKRTCMCSPTTHAGSFRCSLHKNDHSNQTTSYSPNRLNARRSAMTNSLVRIGTVEGDLVKRALAALIRPSSHQQRRRGAFESRPSRLSVMSKADDL